jgi:hypothetical protein
VPASQDAAEVAAGPWVGTVERWVPGRELVAVRRLDARHDPVSEHHTLGGRRISAVDPSLKGLPVVPFTVMAEMLAQAASPLVPGGALAALRDVNAHRWIRYEAEPVRLELRAVRDPATPDEVRVAIFNRGPAGQRGLGGEGPVVEGRVVFAAAREPAPIAPAFSVKGGQPCRRFTATEVYEDQWLFHGPAMQALAELGSASTHGIEGTLRVLPRGALFEDGDASALRTDPIVLDAFTQLLGCWGLNTQTEGDVIFPLRVSEIAFFGQDPPEGSLVSCRIAVRELSRALVRVDADLVTPEGRVWVRIRGWEDWRFYWPGRVRDQFRQPNRFFVGEPLPLPEPREGSPPRGAAAWVEPPVDLGRPIWRDVLEWVQLGPAERLEARSPGLSEREWTMRLWERVAAKEAARRLWLEQGGPAVYPADLAVEAGRDGGHRLRSLAEPSRGDLPTIALARAEGVALALAAADPGARVGVGIEPIPAAVPDDASEPERAGLARIPSAERPEWLARIRAARAALLQALGLDRGDDLAGGIELAGLDHATGEVSLTLATEPRQDRIGRGAETTLVSTARKGDFAWAWLLHEGGAR